MKKWFIIIPTCILLLLIAAYLLAPNFLKNYFNEHSKELTGRKSSINKLSINLFKCSTEIDGFKMYEKDDKTQFVSFKHLHLDINLWKLISSKIVVEEIRIDSPTVSIESYGNGFNFDDFLIENTTKTKKEVKDEKPLEFEILNFSMHKGRIDYFDKPIDHRVFLNNLSFVLPRFVYSNSSSDISTVFKINDDGTLEVTSKYNPVRNSFKCHLKLRKLDLKVAEPYVMSMYNIKDYKGRLHADIDLDGYFTDSSKLIIKGNAWMTDAAIFDKDPIPIIQLDSAFVAIKEADVFKENYRIRKTFVNKLAIRFDMIDSTNNLDQALNGKTKPTESTKTKSSASTLYYSLDSLVLKEGSVLYRDYRMETPYQYRITQIVALAENISSDSKENRLQSYGVLNEKGRYTAYVLVNPQNPLDFTVDFVVNGLQMQDMSPFSLYYAGHPLFKGELVYKGFTKVLNGNLESKNELTIYNLKVGDKIKKKVLYAMPLKFAVFLLKDKNGVVRIKLPLQGTMNDPKFKIGPLIWQVVKQNLGKVVAAPEKMLANQFGMDASKLKYIPFDMTDTLLSKEGVVTLDQLMLLQQKKQGLKTDLSYYSPNLDELNALAMREAKMRYALEKLGSTSQTQAILLAKQTSDKDMAFIQFLKEKAVTESNSSDSLVAKWISTESILPIAKSLQQARNRNVRLYISSTNPVLSPNFIFSDSASIPDFPVNKVGYLIKLKIDE